MFDVPTNGNCLLLFLVMLLPVIFYVVLFGVVSPKDQVLLAVPAELRQKREWITIRVWDTSICIRTQHSSTKHWTQMKSFWPIINGIKVFKKNRKQEFWLQIEQTLRCTIEKGTDIFFAGVQKTRHAHTHKSQRENKLKTVGCVPSREHTAV